VHPQQRPQLLVQRRLRHHGSAVAQRKCEAPNSPFYPVDINAAQVSPVHLRLHSRWSLKAAHRHHARRFPLRLQILFHGAIAATITALPQFTKQNNSVPHANSQPLIDVWLEAVQDARPRLAWTIHPRRGPIQQVPPNRLSVVAS
jgi:hypothetical protein